MEEHWYVEWRGCLVLVVAHVAWIVASTAHARRDLWNALHSVSTPLDGLRFCVLLGILIPAVKTEKGRKPPANRASARADTQMTHRKESNTESGHNTKWLITANGPLQS